MGNIINQKSEDQKAEIFLNIEDFFQVQENKNFIDKFSCKCIPDKQFSKGYTNTISSIVLPNGNRYIGETLNDIPNGRGTEISPLGDVFDGYYLMGRKYGLGQQIQQNNFTYIGCFKDDLFNGTGVILENNDSYTQYNWKEGKEIKKKKQLTVLKLLKFGLFKTQCQYYLFHFFWQKEFINKISQSYFKRPSIFLEDKSIQQQNTTSLSQIKQIEINKQILEQNQISECHNQTFKRICYDNEQMIFPLYQNIQQYLTWSFDVQKHLINNKTQLKKRYSEKNELQFFTQPINIDQKIVLFQQEDFSLIIRILLISKNETKNTILQLGDSQCYKIILHDQQLKIIQLDENQQEQMLHQSQSKLQEGLAYDIFIIKKNLNLKIYIQGFLDIHFDINNRFEQQNVNLKILEQESQNFDFLLVNKIEYYSKSLRLENLQALYIHYNFDMFKIGCTNCLKNEAINKCQQISQFKLCNSYELFNIYYDQLKILGFVKQKVN